MDDNILEMDENLKRKPTEKLRRTENEMQLFEAEEDVRRRALSGLNEKGEE